MNENSAIFLVLPVLLAEMALLAMVYQLRPYANSNRLFAGYMLALVCYQSGEFIAVLADTDGLVAFGVWIGALGVISAGPLLLLLILSVFAPRNGFWDLLRVVSWVLLLVGLVSILADGLAGTTWMVELGLISTSNSKLSFLAADSPLLGRVLFQASIASFIIYLLPLIYFSVAGQVPVFFRRAARLLVVMGLVTTVVYVATAAFVPVLWRSMVTSLAIGGGLALTIGRYRLLMPVSLGLQQAVVKAEFGLLVFDNNGRLLESNETAVKALNLMVSNRQPVLLTDCVRRFNNLMPQAESLLQADVILAGEVLQRELRTNGRVYQVRIEPVLFAEAVIVGVMWSLQDITREHTALQDLQVSNQELRIQVRLITFLNQITETAVASSKPDALYELLITGVADLFAADECSLALWDDELQIPIPTISLTFPGYVDLQIIPGEKTLTEVVLNSKKPLWVPDLAHSPYLSPRIASTAQVQSVLVVPLFTEDQKLGAVLIGHLERRLYSPREMQWVEQIADQMALVLARTRLLEVEREQREIGEVLVEMSTQLNRMLDIDTVLEELLVQLQRVVPYDTASIMWVDGDKARMAVSRVNKNLQSDKEITDFRTMTLRIADVATFSWMQEQQRPLIIPDTRTYPGWQNLPGTQHIDSWAGAPIIVGNETIAFFSIDKTTPHFYREKHRYRMQAVAAQASMAMQNAMLLTDAHRHALRMEALNMLSAEISQQISVRDLCQAVATRIHEEFGFPRISVYLVGTDGQTLTREVMAGTTLATVHTADYQQPTSTGLLAQALRQGELILVNDTENDPDFVACDSFPTRAEIVVPLVVNGRTVGVLNIDSDQKNAFDDADVLLLRTIADYMIVGLARARLFEETQQHLWELQQLTDFTAELRLVDTQEEILPLILTRAIAVVGFEVGAVLLMDGDAFVSRYSQPADFYATGIPHPADKGITGYVATTGKIYVSSDLDTDPIYEVLPYEPSVVQKLKSLVSLPLFSEAGLIGVMHIGSGESRVVSDGEQRLLAAMMDLAANALFRAEVLVTLEDRVQQRTQELAQANERLQELDRLKSKFVSDMSHELRTPVANLVLYLDLLAHTDSEEKKAKYTAVLRDKGQQLVRLTEDILGISRLDIRQEPLRLVPCQLNDIVIPVLAGHQQRAETMGLAWTTDLADDLPLIMGEPNQLAQALTHLLQNAMLYTVEGTISVCTNLGDDGQVALVVQDTGCGISDAEMTHIFERFYRGERISQLTLPGTGLGLAVVHEIVELHNGRISVVSEVDKGSTFTIYLPVVPQTES